jgi:hypothetical protein
MASPFHGCGLDLMLVLGCSGQLCVWFHFLRLPLHFFTSSPSRRPQGYSKPNTPRLQLTSSRAPHPQSPSTANTFCRSRVLSLSLWLTNHTPINTSPPRHRYTPQICRARQRSTASHCVTLTQNADCHSTHTARWRPSFATSPSPQQTRRLRWSLAQTLSFR